MKSRRIGVPNVEDLPSPPVALTRLIESASQPEFRLSDLLTPIEQTPTFSLVLIQLANSSQNGVRQVHSTKRAVMTLGARTVRNQAVAHVARSLAKSLDTDTFDLGQFWSDSVHRATAARELAKQTRILDPSEAFTMGLVLDIGVLALCILCPDKAAEWNEARNKHAGARREKEQELFGTTHDAFFGDLARAWDLPDNLAHPVRCHHDPDADDLPEESRSVARLLCAADHIADVMQTRGDGRSVRAARKALDALIPDGSITVEQVLETLGDEATEAGRAVDLPVEEQPSIAEMFCSVSETVVHLLEEYERMTQQLEEALRERRQLGSLLQRSRDELSRLNVTDPVTGAANRRKFGDLAREAYERSKRARQPMSLLIMEFQGHNELVRAMGDQHVDVLLRQAAHQVQLVLRPDDVVCRISSDALVVMLPGMTARSAHGMGSRLLTAVCEDANENCLVLRPRAAGVTIAPDASPARRRVPPALKAAFGRLSTSNGIAQGIPWASTELVGV